MNGDTAMTTGTGPVTGPPRAPARPTMTPGRWVTLAIGVPIALVLIVGGGLSLVSDIGTASFRVDRTIPLDHGRLVARANGSDLTVRQGSASGGAARLTGTVHYGLVRPDFSVSGSGINLHCRYLLSNCGLNATLSVPPGTALDLASGGGNMQVSDVQAAVTLSSRGGDIALSGAGGAVTVDSGGGNLSVSHLGGILNFTTGGGDVDGSDLTSPKVTTDLGGGNVTLTFTSPPANLSVTSGGGDVTIVLPPGTTEYAIKESTGGGDYGAKVPRNDLAANKITVDSGGGNVSITQD